YEIETRLEFRRVLSRSSITRIRQGQIRLVKLVVDMFRQPLGPGGVVIGFHTPGGIVAAYRVLVDGDVHMGHPFDSHLSALGHAEIGRASCSASGAPGGR